MKNNEKHSIEYEIASCETSLRWLAGEATPNTNLIAKHVQQIRLLKSQLNGENLGLIRDEFGFFINN